ncbi:MAG: formate dehydrogenase accessory sulfurtransferase FdhD [Thermoanaerobaculia bacterium]
MTRPDPTVAVDVQIVQDGRAQSVPDTLAAEAPLEIQLAAGGEEAVLAVTLRTPGSDEELATGLLYAEGVIGGAEDIAAVRRPAGLDGAPLPHRILVELAAAELPDLAASARHGFATAACGLCGKTSLEALDLARVVELSSGPALRGAVIAGLPAAMQRAQTTFAATGGLHAAALFTPDGELLALREDVGRHNALDKLIGWALHQRRLPLAEALILLSGRAGYELVAKALMAGCPVLAAVSAPSSFAVATARAHGMTLIGFLRQGRFNVYSGPERLGL